MPANWRQHVASDLFEVAEAAKDEFEGKRDKRFEIEIVKTGHSEFKKREPDRLTANRFIRSLNDLNRGS